MAAMTASTGPEVNDVVCTCHDIEIVFDANYRVSLSDEGIEGSEELGHIVEMKSGRGLVEDEDSVACTVSFC